MNAQVSAMAFALKSLGEPSQVVHQRPHGPVAHGNAHAELEFGVDLTRLKLVRTVS